MTCNYDKMEILKKTFADVCTKQASVCVWRINLNRKIPAAMWLLHMFYVY